QKAQLTVRLVKYLSLATSTFILRVSRAHYRLVWAALAFMDHVPVKNGKHCVMRVVRVSGTMRKAGEEAVERDRRLIGRAKEAEGDLNVHRAYWTKNAELDVDVDVEMEGIGDED